MLNSSQFIWFSFICEKKNRILLESGFNIYFLDNIIAQLFHQLPAVWFSWEELFTGIEIPIRNNTIVTVDKRKKKKPKAVTSTEKNKK